MNMQKDFKIIALICCRGGSKGIPGKNIKNFAGKPLLGWILESAKASNVFDEIILSTDSEEIANVGRIYGATVPGLRPIELAQDKSDQFDTHNYIFDLLGYTDETHRICILTNNPLINQEIITEGFSAFKESNFERVVLDTVKVPGDYMFFRQCFEHNGLLRFHFPKGMLDSQINRQTVAPTFTTINNMRWGKPSFFRNYDSYKTEVTINGIVPVSLPKLNNVDIDDIDDWNIAEAIFIKFFQNK
jgi:CMP-N-acetylneuraminic acid synthetase